ncbi:hypothetical protein [Flavobacterium sp. NRK1]|uniref:hypothetical protein n=1 Tax=Flavobacterium sp. NRK1 TaxID=2954929 RepID=UPI002092A349|nr:hypothetical protein [Flavobacterium sp. NRK1]MCO6148698.1 hypothetical protein [Flavobacterium sp. NRK1]
MQHNFDVIKDAFKKAGIDVKKAGFSITEYSLNTKLSFKFNNLDEFLFFLNLTHQEDTKRIEEINTMLIEAGIKPESFFYVNFFKQKIAEL